MVSAAKNFRKSTAACGAPERTACPPPPPNTSVILPAPPSTSGNGKRPRSAPIPLPADFSVLGAH
ncbi:hypothetical protein BIV25_42775 [Streptomyces sp. MUSC 14]|nr:hypothetical protein BIV25_42775 [Streptomyces sp. MUSC 14]